MGTERIHASVALFIDIWGAWTQGSLQCPTSLHQPSLLKTEEREVSRAKRPTTLNLAIQEVLLPEIWALNKTCNSVCVAIVIWSMHLHGSSCTSQAHIILA